DGATDTATLTITVTDTDRFPNAVNDVNTAVENGPAVNGDVSTNDTPGDPPTVLTSAVDDDGDAITLGVAFGTDAGGSLTLNADGTYSYAPPSWNLVPPAGLTEVFTYTITDADGDTDSATLTITVTDEDRTPDISVSKSADPTSVPETGGNVTFTYTVTNNSLEAATITALSDDRFGPLTGDADCQVTTVLAPLASCSFEATFAVPAGDFPGSHVDVFSATVSDGDGDTDTATNTATVTYTDVSPAAFVTKTADPTSIPEPGGSIDFDVTVENTGAVSAVVVSLTDSVFGDITSTGHHGITATDCGTGALLMPGNTYSCTFTATISGNAGDTHANTVTITLRDNDGSEGSDTDDASVDVTDVLSSATVQKTADPASVVAPGANVAFTVRVDNASTVDTLTLTALTDDVFGDITNPLNPAIVSTTCSVPQTLDPGEFYVCSFDAFVGGDPGATHHDTLIATLTDNDGNTLTPSGEATVNIQGASIGIAKRVVSVVEVSAGTYDVTYRFVVRNYGEVPLSNIQVTDSLAGTFPAPTTFTVQSVSSADFSENWPGYDGSGNVNLLAGTDSLPVGASGAIDLVVRIIPASNGPFDNTAFARGEPPSGDPVSDESADGTDPDNTADCPTCTNDDGDPGNNAKPTPIIFSASIFDPPFGVKTVNAAGEPVLQWTMVWINNSNIVAVNAAVSDEVPVGAAFDAGGGVTCSETSPITTTTRCEFETPSPSFPRGRIVWEGALGPDFGVTDPALAVHKITITFNLVVSSGITSVQNNATIDSDLNGDGDTDDAGEQRVAEANAAWNKDEQPTVVEKDLPKLLPATGFAPGRVTELGNPPEGAYSSAADLRLEIPSLRLAMPVVGIPLQDGQWDVTWLWNQAGWLEGSAYPTLPGNSVLTAHVYLSNGKPGPFVNLGRLAWGDKIYIQTGDLRYIYEVRSVSQVDPGNTSAFKHEQYSWLTLVTCRQYDEATNSYLKRMVVRAVLLEVVELP
ncbi:MAG: sortase, partial [Chloroflexi bacterium]|nr:sortase [Chloroflexota bacterium]